MGLYPSSEPMISKTVSAMFDNWNLIGTYIELTQNIGGMRA